GRGGGRRRRIPRDRQHTPSSPTRNNTSMTTGIHDHPPLVLSIVVPVYNERFLVGELLGKLLVLEIPEVSTEIIIVDDGSTDGTRELLRELVAKHPDELQLIEQQRNQGKGAALRRGIAAATGDLIVFQDADLEYDPRDLARMVTPFLEDSADVVY